VDDLVVDWTIILKNFKQIGRRVVGWINSAGDGQVTNCCEHGTEPAGYIKSRELLQPITEVARSKDLTFLARSITRVVDSNPTRDMDVCVRLFCVCVVLCIGL
jgi:hypothetical protein